MWYLVENSDFNKRHYPDLIGRVCSEPPSYCEVRAYDLNNPVMTSNFLSAFASSLQHLLGKMEICKTMTYEQSIQVSEELLSRCCAIPELNCFLYALTCTDFTQEKKENEKIRH